jgi:hypothetical protein
MKKRFDLFRFTSELMGLASMALIAYGVHLIYRPAAWIFLGVICGIPYIVSTLKSLQDKER